MSGNVGPTGGRRGPALRRTLVTGSTSLALGDSGKVAAANQAGAEAAALDDGPAGENGHEEVEDFKAAGLSTGEDAIEFFGRNGMTSDIKVLFLNRALQEGVNFRPVSASELFFSAHCVLVVASVMALLRTYDV